MLIQPTKKGYKMFIKEEQVSYEKTYTNTRWLLALDSPMFNKKLWRCTEMLTLQDYASCY